MNKVVTKQIDLSGQTLKLETGKLAQLAEASVMASLGETVVLVAVTTKPTTEPLDHFPLAVEYVEKYYAGGRITGQKFIKREARPTDQAILSGRAIDRSIRPLFPKDFHNEVQIIVTVLSYDGVNDPAVLGLIGTSAALSISSIPWAGPLGVTRVGERDGSLIVNPILTDLEHLTMDLVVASTKEKVVMIEADAKETADEVVFEAIKQAHESSQTTVNLIDEFTKEAGKPKQTYTSLADSVDESLLKPIKTAIKERIEAALFDQDHPWHESTGETIKADLEAQYREQGVSAQTINGLFDKVAKEIMNKTILTEGKRVDGRGMEEVRPIEIETGILPRTHGSAVFKRGDTQVLSITTLGPLSLSQTLEGMTGESQKRFIHHYNMSINPFATGDVKRIGSPNRRDTGHGDLVERGLLGVLPSEDKFPYAIRVVSEVLAANASTSMASLCAATLALLNAGVPVTPVAGIALGLLSSDKKFQVITDMRAVEDFYGEMDFKVTGSLKGVTAIQMDTKLQGLSFEIIEEALKQGKKAREAIIAKMNEVSPAPAEISKYAPKIEVAHIKPEDIGLLIGPGGKNINGIIARTGAQIDIEDDGTVMVSSTDQTAIKNALDAVNGMFKEINVGDEFDGKVVRIAPFGAFVEIAPGKDGLVHISQLAPGRVEQVEDVVSEGQEVHVRVTEVEAGKVGLSMLFGADIKPESEGRPSGRREASPSAGGWPRREGGFGSSRSGAGSPRFGAGDRGASRGFSRPSSGSRFGGGERRGFSGGGERRGFGTPRTGMGSSRGGMGRRDDRNRR